MPCHHDWPPASGQPNEAPYRSLASVPFTHMPPAALQPGLLIIDRTGRARNREDCNASAAGCVLLKHIVALGKTVTARQINQVRPRPSRVNGIAPGLLNDAMAQKPSRPKAPELWIPPAWRQPRRPFFLSSGLPTSWLRAQCIGVCASAERGRTRARIGDDFRRCGGQRGTARRDPAGANPPCLDQDAINSDLDGHGNCRGRSLRSRSRRPSGGALHRTDPGPDSANPIERSLSVL